MFQESVNVLLIILHLKQYLCDAAAPNTFDYKQVTPTLYMYAISSYTDFLECTLSQMLLCALHRKHILLYKYNVSIQDLFN